MFALGVTLGVVGCVLFVSGGLYYLFDRLLADVRVKARPRRASAMMTIGWLCMAVGAFLLGLGTNEPSADDGSGTSRPIGPFGIFMAISIAGVVFACGVWSRVWIAETVQKDKEAYDRRYQRNGKRRDR